ncbi:MAG: hypothetical protein R3C32_02585 [Chloroflexota bacterium]
MRGAAGALRGAHQGKGRNESPGEVAARTVELIDAMHRSAAAGGVPVDVWQPV